MGVESYFGEEVAYDCSNGDSDDEGKELLFHWFLKAKIPSIAGKCRDVPFEVKKKAPYNM